jgi:ADP-ribose pyrophosphatase
LGNSEWGGMQRGMQPWKTVARQVVLEHSKFLTVEEHTVELPDGRVIDHWPWLITPDFVNVVAVTEDDLALFFRQTKYALEGTTLAPVGGFLEPDEAPLAGAQRELLEETGFQAPEWTKLGSFRVDPNRGVAMGHLFLARGARRVAEPDADDLEEQELLYLSRSEMEAALAGGEFQVLAWATSVLLALRYLEG